MRSPQAGPPQSVMAHSRSHAESPPSSAAAHYRGRAPVILGFFDHSIRCTLAASLWQVSTQGSCCLQLLPRPRIVIRFAGSGQLSYAADDAETHGGAQAAQQPPSTEAAAHSRRRWRQSGEGRSKNQPPGHRLARLVSMDSACDAEYAIWPRDRQHWRQLPAREPLSPADSASELLDPPSGWFKADAASRVLNRSKHTHSRRHSNGGRKRAQAGSAPGPHASQAAMVASGDTSQLASAVTSSAGASRRRRLRVLHSAFASSAAAAEALRSHPLSGLHSKGHALAPLDAQQMAQRSAARVASPLHTSRLGSSTEIQSAPAPARITCSASLAPINVSTTGSSQPYLGRGTLTAAESLGHDGSAGCPPPVAAVLNDCHLLAFGALIGEQAAAAALSARSGSQVLQDGAGSLFGAVDRPACPWELVVQVCPGQFAPMCSAKGFCSNCKRFLSLTGSQAQTCVCGLLLNCRAHDVRACPLLAAASASSCVQSMSRVE